MHSLDVLRGLAALAVVFWHWQHFFYEGNRLDQEFRFEMQPFSHSFDLLYRHGYLAVDLFFLLSGFIFFWLYSTSITNREVTARDFFILRFSRLYPRHFATLIAVCLMQIAYWSITGTTFVYANNDFYHFVLNVFFTSSVGLERGYSFNGPIWSVSVEVILYLTFFALCRAIRVRPSVLLCASIVGFFILTDLNQPISRGVGSFFLGGLVYKAFISLVESRSSTFLTRLTILVATASWICIIGWSFLEEGMGLNSLDLSLSKMPFLWRVAEIVPRVFIFPVTVLALALIETDYGPIFRKCSWVGDISYSSYLLHFPLQLLFAIIALQLGLGSRVFYSPLIMILFFCVLISISLISHRFLEMPAQRYIRCRWLVQRRRTVESSLPGFATVDPQNPEKSRS